MTVKDVVLPGEMKTILNQVIEAEKRAAANVILRREETAATRSLLNTAKLLEQNPTLLRLKELEAWKEIAEKVSQLTGVGLVSISGGQKPAVRIQANPTALASYGLSLEDARTVLGQANALTAPDAATMTVHRPRRWGRAMRLPPVVTRGRTAPRTSRLFERGSVAGVAQVRLSCSGQDRHNFPEVVA